MAEVVGIHRRRDALIADLARELPEQGIVQRDVDTLTVEVEVWRRAARSAARILGRPVQTSLDPSGTLVWAALTDWPADADEQTRQRQGTRAAVLRLPNITGEKQRRKAQLDLFTFNN